MAHISFCFFVNSFSNIPVLSVLFSARIFQTQAYICTNANGKPEAKFLVYSFRRFITFMTSNSVSNASFCESKQKRKSLGSFVAKDDRGEQSMSL